MEKRRRIGSPSYPKVGWTPVEKGGWVGGWVDRGGAGGWSEVLFVRGWVGGWEDVPMKMLPYRLPYTSMSLPSVERRGG